MLKQILQDMRVEADILNGLTDTEKQTLFCIMREEQIRRWRLFDQEQMAKEEAKKSNSMINSDDDTYNSVNMKGNRKKAKKNHSVQFLLGEDGEPWVWIMGEHESDKSIEQILADEAQQKARELAEQEAKEFRKSVEAELTEIIEYQHKDNFELDEKKAAQKKLSDDEDNNTPIIDDLEIYCSVDELRDRVSANNKLNQTPPKISRIGTSFSKTNNKFDTKCNVLQEISNKPQIMKPTKKVAARVALWEQRLITERSNEILKGIQKKQLEKTKEAEEAARNNEDFWREQGMLTTKRAGQ